MLRLAVVVGWGWRTNDSTIDAPSSMKTRKLVGDRFKRFSMEYIQKIMSFLQLVSTTRAFAIVSSAQLFASRPASRQWPHYISPPRWRQPAGAAHARVHVLLQISWKPRPRTACLELGRRDTLPPLIKRLPNGRKQLNNQSELGLTYEQ